MKKKLNRLKNLSFKFHVIANHFSHTALRQDSKTYSKAIIQAKRSHWSNYLEEMTADKIWTANKYLKDPPGDGGMPRIPSLKSKNALGITSTTDDNKGKASIFAKTFFPPPLQQTQQANNQQHKIHPEPYPNPPPITANQILAHISKLQPYKAHGPDGIPNIVLKECADLIITPLTNIFKAIINLDTYYDPWKEFTTIVLRKPGKPNYETPKAYRPIVLIPTMAKLLTAIRAEQLSNLVERHQILPKNHFGGRPGRSTTDAIQYLISKIHKAWNQNKVISILFLNVEGVFPNAVTTQLINNMKKRRIPMSIIKFIQNLLTNRRTCIKFDDYISDLILLENGIGQGDPLSMLLYIIYNADLLDLPTNPKTEDTIGYVDDIAIVAMGKDLHQTTQQLEYIMTRNEGGLDWSRTHNSRFKVNKLAIAHFSKKYTQDLANNNK